MRPSLLSALVRCAMALTALAAGMGAVAQGGAGSLTDQFPDLSAKERSRIAAKESEEAQKDGSYQEVMRAAELSFQEGRYEEAIKRYEDARAMRPYNVYPKVKIEDLRALIARQAAKPDTTAAVEEPPLDPASASTPVSVPEPVPPAQEPIVEPPAFKEAPDRGTTPEPVVERATVSGQGTPVMKAAEGIIEQRYREGHAFVIERAVTVEGRLVKYKRVYHPYGLTFYFEDGLSVDERVWNARFPGR